MQHLRAKYFLKLLLHFKYIRYRRTHDLKILFELLPEDLKDNVKYCCVKRYGQWLDCFNLEYLKKIFLMHLVIGVIITNKIGLKVR